MIKCELCRKKVRIHPSLRPIEHEFVIDGWAFCHDCKIKLFKGIE